MADLEDGERTVVDEVFDKYGRHGGWYLSRLTHSAGSPWDRTWGTYGKNAVIPQELIRTHYKEIMAQYETARQANRQYFPEAL